MNILIVAATAAEVAPLQDSTALTRFEAIGVWTPPPHRPMTMPGRSGRSIDILITGVGMVAAATYTSRALAQQHYDLALNLGVCGTFDRALPLGSVVHVVADRIVELGAENADAFLTIDDLQLPGTSVFVNTSPPVNVALSRLPQVTGVTVNTVHGHEPSIRAVTCRFGPQVESMEGAAFMAACLAANVSFAQIRAVSNVIETRDARTWQLDEAISNLGRCALSVVEHA